MKLMVLIFLGHFCYLAFLCPILCRKIRSKVCAKFLQRFTIQVQDGEAEAQKIADKHR